MSTKVLTEGSPKPLSDEGDSGKAYKTNTPLATSVKDLKERIRTHYEKASDYYQAMWGEHIHHGYFKSPGDTKEAAQLNLIELLLERSQLKKGSSVLDVGCGIGGSSRHLAKFWDCRVTGVTISARQVEIAKNLAYDEAFQSPKGVLGTEYFQLGRGEVRFLELDAEGLGDYFGFSAEPTTFQAIWIVEAMSHLPDKDLFYRNAELLLDDGGCLIVADWFKAEDLTPEQADADIKPIEDGMLLPPLCTQSDYVRMAEQVGLKVFSAPFDISQDVSKTWDIGWSLIQNPALWAFALSQGRDAIAFLKAFRSMKKAYTNGTFRYSVMVFEKSGASIGQVSS